MSTDDVSETPVTRVRPTRELPADDQAALAAIGAEQVFERRFNFWTALAFGVCTTGTWAGISASIAQALTAGGPVGLIYGYIISAVGMTSVAASLAELSSIWPSAGAQYVWVSQLSSLKWRPFLSWFSAWLSFTSLWLCTISACFGVAVQTQAYIIVSQPSYEPERWHVTLIFWAYLTTSVVLNVFAIRWFHLINMTVMGVHISGFIIIMVTLLVTTKDKHSASYVFTTFENSTGWPSNGLSFCIGLLSTIYGFVSIEQPVHYAEEIKDVTRNVPRAFFMNVAVNALVTFPWLIAFVFCMGDMSQVLASPIGLLSPVTQVFLNSTGSIPGAIIMNMFSSTLAFVAGVDSLGGAARVLWSLAREDGLPEIISRVHPKWDVPVWTILIISVPAYLIGIIYIFNSTAFYGIIAGQIVAMILSYMMPIALHLYQRRKNNITYGPWTLGKIGSLVDIISISFTIFIAVVLSIPVYYPVTSENMNYASVLVGAVVILSAITWYVYGKGKYYGNVPEVSANRTVVLNGQEVVIPTKLEEHSKKI